MKFIINETDSDLTFEQLSVGDIFETSEGQIMMKIRSPIFDVNCLELTTNINHHCTPYADWAPGKLRIKKLLGKLEKIEK